jgi:integrase
MSGISEVREAQLKERGETPGPLFRTRTGKALNRQEALLQRIARQANAHLPSEEHIRVSPHFLRHTFFRKAANTRGCTTPWSSRDIGATATSGAM